MKLVLMHFHTKKISFHYHVFFLSPHSSIILRPLSIFSLSSLHPLFTAILLPIPSPHLFSLTARLSLAPFTTPLLTLLTSSYFSPLGEKHVYFSLCTLERECSIATQLQVSAKQMLLFSQLPLHAWSALETIEVSICAAATVRIHIHGYSPMPLCFLLQISRHLSLFYLFLYLQLVLNYCTFH